MQYVLYNELSNNGRGKEILEVVKGKVNGEYETVNVVGLDPKEFVQKLTADDLIILCGGDGTLNQFANYTADLEIPCDVLLFPAGTGNDFYEGAITRPAELLWNFAKCIKGTVPGVNSLDTTYKWYRNIYNF